MPRRSRFYKRALAIFEKVGRSRLADVAPTLNNLAALYQRQDRFADAEPLFRRALSDPRKIAGARAIPTPASP